MNTTPLVDPLNLSSSVTVQPNCLCIQIKSNWQIIFWTDGDLTIFWYFMDKAGKITFNFSQTLWAVLFLYCGFADTAGPHFLFFFSFEYLFFCEVHFLFSRLLCVYFLIPVRATEGREDGDMSSSVILFPRLDAFIDSASAASLLTEQPLNHIHSMLHPCHTHCEVCICVWLWLIFILYGCFLRVTFILCCDVQFAIRQGVWNEEPHSKMWCITLWEEMKFITLLKIQPWKHSTI